MEMSGSAVHHPAIFILVGLAITPKPQSLTLRCSSVWPILEDQVFLFKSRISQRNSKIFSPVGTEANECFQFMKKTGKSHAAVFIGTESDTYIVLTDDKTGSKMS
jgi:hypothetical protein